MNIEKNYIIELILVLLLIISAFLCSFTFIPAINSIFYGNNNPPAAYICFFSFCSFCLSVFLLFIKLLIRIIIYFIKKILKKG